jgi:hypothetical protein
VVLQLGSWAWGVRTPHRKNKFVTKCQKGPRTWTDSLNKRSKLRKKDMRFGTIGWGGLDWIDLAQDRDQWRAIVNTVMNLRVS